MTQSLFRGIVGKQVADDRKRQYQYFGRGLVQQHKAVRVIIPLLASVYDFENPVVYSYLFLVASSSRDHSSSLPS